MQQRTLYERVFHAVLYEAIAIAATAFIMAGLMSKPLVQTSALAVMLSTLAMLWNMIYNAAFDRCYPLSRRRGLGLRVGHAIGFEGGFIIASIPIAAWMLGISLPKAFMLEAGFLLFFFPYTIVFNGIYDALRNKALS